VCHVFFETHSACLCASDALFLVQLVATTVSVSLSTNGKHLNITMMPLRRMVYMEHIVDAHCDITMHCPLCLSFLENEIELAVRTPALSLRLSALK